MNNLIKFSIFTPTYNGEKFIKSCIDSVLNQNLTEFEWYIYDDGSTDSTYDVLKKLVLNDRRVHLSRGDNGNSIERMNDFLDNAKGQYIAFIDHDDIWNDKDFLNSIYSKLIETKSDCLVTSYTLIDKKNNILNSYTPTLNDSLILNQKQLKIKFLTSLEIEGFRWNKFYRNSTVKMSGLKFKKNSFPADLPFEFDLLDHVNTAVLLDNHNYLYRQLSQSEVGNINQKKISGFLETYNKISKKAEKSLPFESWYYYSWRYINLIFDSIKNKKICKNQLSEILSKYPLKNCVKNNIINTILLINKIKNHREGRFIFSLKILCVWIYCKFFR